MREPKRARVKANTATIPSQIPTICGVASIAEKIKQQTDVKLVSARIGAMHWKASERSHKSQLKKTTKTQQNLYPGFRKGVPKEDNGINTRKHGWLKRLHTDNSSVAEMGTPRHGQSIVRFCFLHQNLLISKITSPHCCATSCALRERAIVFSMSHFVLRVHFL